MVWRESAQHEAQTTVENRENESVSMRMSPTNRMAVSAPYITHGYIGTPNNFACGGGEGVWHHVVCRHTVIHQRM